MVKEETIVDKKTGENVDPDREIILRKAILAESGDSLRVEEFNEEEKLHGIQKGWFDDGKLQYEFTYRDGKPHGSIKEYYASGAIMLDIFYHHVGAKSLEVQRGTYYREDGKNWEFSAADGKDKKKKVVEIEDGSYFKKYLAQHKK